MLKCMKNRQYTMYTARSLPDNRDISGIPDNWWPDNQGPTSSDFLHPSSNAFNTCMSITVAIQLTFFWVNSSLCFMLPFISMKEHSF